MKKVIVLIALMTVSLSQAALVTLEYEGTVSSFGYYMGSGYSNPLFSIGDDVSVTVIYDDTNNTLASMAYTISNTASGGGQSFGFSVTDLSNHISSIQTDEGIFAYATKIPPAYDNWALTFNRDGADDNFSHNYGHAPDGTEAYAWNFNASIVPEPATMVLLGLGGLLIRKTKRT